MKIFNFIAVLEGDAVDLAIAADVHFHTLRQGVDHRNTHPVQATRELVVLAGEFAARMQPAQDQLNRRNPFFRVDINRHPASIVDHFQRLIGMKNDLHAFRMASQCFIHTVINNFLAEMVRTCCVSVHPRTAANRL